jgi:hypothetical protein
MKKKGLKAILFTMIFTLLFAGFAFANNATDHVSVAPNGKGDVLIFPTYFTGSGWETKLIVTNTSMTESVVAKVVIRSKERSQELRDFMIFLSPADVWTGVLYINATDGRPHITSTDDSCLFNTTTFASAANPFDVDLVDTCVGDTNELGYVTVIQGASFSLAPFQPGVTKASILAAYNAWIALPSAATANTPINVMIGQEEIYNTGASIEYALNATVLKNHDWDINQQLWVQAESWIGQTGNTNNSLGEIEAALSKNDLAVPYYSQALGSVFAIVSFPTKLAGFPCGTSNWRGPFSGFPTPSYSMTAYDLMENTISVTGPWISPTPTAATLTFPSEVNFIGVNDLPGTFDEGWLRILGNAYTTTTLRNDSGTISYTGLPMIATSMRSTSTGLSGWLYNSYTTGTVDIDSDGVFDGTAGEFNYHYWEQTDF